MVNHLYKFFLLTSLIFIVGMNEQLNCSSREPICSKDTVTSALPADAKKALDSHASELKEFLKKCNNGMGFNVCKKEWLPGYYIKYGIQRVNNAEKLKAIIKEHNLDLLSVPEKYLYHVPETADQLSDQNYVAVVKEVSGNHGKGQFLNEKQVKQLCKVALHAKHYDLHPANYISQKDGTLVIIDTDAHAMPSTQEIKQREEDWLLHGTRIHDGNGGTFMNPEIINDPLTKLELPMYSKHRNYDDKAWNYLYNEVKKREELRLQLNGKELKKQEESESQPNARNKMSTLKKALTASTIVVAAAYGIYRAVCSIYK